MYYICRKWAFPLFPCSPRPGVGGGRGLAVLEFRHCPSPVSASVSQAVIMKWGCPHPTNVGKLGSATLTWLLNREPCRAFSKLIKYIRGRGHEQEVHTSGIS